MLTPSNTIVSSERRLLMGLGVTGQSVARWWRRQGVKFTAIETREELASHSAAVADVDPAAVTFGEVDASWADGFTEMIVSPGVPLDHPLVVRASEQGCRVRGDIDLFIEAAKAPVVGITGSNGKSTVTSLLGDMIEACGVKVAVGGNLGRPALDLLPDEADLYVLELSSFQLERAETLGLRLATVLNISADHLDRYATLSDYHRAKHAIFRRVSQVVANRDDPLTVPLVSDSVPVTWWRMGEPDLDGFGVREIDGALWICRGFEKLMCCDALKIAGDHNIANVLAALALGSALELPMAGLLKGAAGFRGLPHRCQLVRKVNGVRYVDDSKGTNVGATEAALTGLFSEGPIWLILGGQGKGQDFSPLQQVVSERCAGLLVLGQAAAEITDHLGRAARIEQVDTVEEAVLRASRLARSGDTVLLSPACASLDMFSSYVERGERFQYAVQALEVAS